MRQRLEQYFSEEGANEPIRLTIPKGTYIPVFEAQVVTASASEMSPPEALPADVAPAETDHGGTAVSISRRFALGGLATALALACVTIAYLLAQLHTGTRTQASASNSHPLWSAFFASGRPVTIVCSDTSLAIVEDLTKHTVELPEYLNSNYRMYLAAPSGTTPEVVRALASRRYTSIVDAGILSRFYRLPQVHPDQVQVRYARDLRADELKDGSAVLIGAQQSNPWVGLFEPHMNFIFRDNLRLKIFSVINQSPRSGELAQYEYDESSPSQKIYGVAALRPNLSGTGKVLLLEGTSMAGTEAAADFVFDDSVLLPFLARIRAPDGSLPYFEVLLQSTNMNGSASQLKIIAYRTSSN
jgi:hypothetical protein